MSGIKQIYRSPDAFRFPTYDATLSYPVNTVVNHYDSESDSYRHYISKKNTTPGSIDSDIIFDEWVSFAFDSDTLYYWANRAIQDNFNSLVGAVNTYYKTSHDSDVDDLKHRIDSETAVLAERIKRLSYADSDWVIRNILRTIHISDLGADSEWVLRLFGSNVTFKLLGADSDWVLRQIPKPNRAADSDWVLRQIPEPNRAADSDWVLRQIPEPNRAADSDWVLRQIPKPVKYQNDSDWITRQIPTVPVIKADSDWVIRYVTEQNRGADSDWVLRLIGDTLTWDNDITYIKNKSDELDSDFDLFVHNSNAADSDILNKIQDNDSDIFVIQIKIDSDANRFDTRFTHTPVHTSGNFAITNWTGDSERDITSVIIGAHKPLPYSYPDVKFFYTNQGANVHPTLKGRLLNGTKGTPLLGYRVEHDGTGNITVWMNTNITVTNDIHIVSTFRTQ